MSTETFNYTADVGSGLEIVQLTKEVELGNGYTQVVGDGLNLNRQIWSFSFFGYRELLQPALDFLLAHTGRSFLWETPLGETIRVRASNIAMPSNGADAYTLSARFTQTFVP